jgi:Tfp pilus assembly protein PilO
MQDLISRFPITLVLVAWLGYLGYDYYWFTSNQDSPLLQRRAQIEELNRSNQELQAEIKRAEAFFAKLNTQKTQLRDLSQRLSEMKVTVSEDLDIASFVKMVITEAKKVGVNVLSLRPSKQTKAEFYVEQAFELHFKSVYVQMVVFLERLSNIQKIVRVDNFSIRPVTSSSSNYVELDVTLELKVYSYLASKADEIGRATSAASVQAAPKAIETPKTGGDQ